MEGFINSILNKFQNLGLSLLELLPRSPFKAFIDSIEQNQMMKFLNFFLPIDIVVPILVAWGTAIGLYYMYQMILRWVKMID